MKSRIEIIEEAIARTNRRIERIEELYLSGELNGEHADYAERQAFEELSELERELHDYLDMEDGARNAGLLDIDDSRGKW